MKILLSALLFVSPLIGNAAACPPQGCISSYLAMNIEVLFSQDHILSKQQAETWYAKVAALKPSRSCKISIGRVVPSSLTGADPAVIIAFLETHEEYVAGVRVLYTDEQSELICPKLIQAIKEEALKVNPEAKPNVRYTGTL